jgi:transcriptional regulator with XRE-family HTH domain
MSTIDRKIGRRIAEQRRLAGLSQARLADKMNVATETLSRLETGRAMPSLVRMTSIAQALGVELHDLFRVRPENDARDRALEKLVWVMSRRTAREIDLVTGIAASVFDHIGGRPGT